MRLRCPLCGLREHGEFTFLGDANLMQRPDPTADNVATHFHDYVHIRDNPAGEHDELWFHDGGCRAWLVVSRNTVSHAISDVVEVAQYRAKRAALVNEGDLA